MVSSNSGRRARLPISTREMAKKGDMWTAEEDALLGVSPADYAPLEGGLLQNTGDEFLTALHA